MSTSTNSKTATIKRLRAISNLLDNAIPIPGTPYRFGIDPLLGMLPAGGDIIGAVISAYIVFSAAQLGLPRESLLRMVFNILLEAIVGIVPVLGDLFDFAWKANAKNIQLLENHLDSPSSTEKADWWFVFLLLGGLLLTILILIVAGVWIVGWFISLLIGNQ